MAEGFLSWIPAFAAVCALGLFVIGVGLVFQRKWAKRELDLLRKKYQEMDVTDPQYNAARALYIASAIDYHHFSADHFAGGSDAIPGAGGDNGSGGGGD